MSFFINTEFLGKVAPLQYFSVVSGGISRNTFHSFSFLRRNVKNAVGNSLCHPSYYCAKWRTIFDFE